MADVERPGRGAAAPADAPRSTTTTSTEGSGMNRRDLLGLSLAAVGGIFAPRFGRWYRRASGLMVPHWIVTVDGKVVSRVPFGGGIVHVDVGLVGPGLTTLHMSVVPSDPPPGGPCRRPFGGTITHRNDYGSALRLIVPMLA